MYGIKKTGFDFEKIKKTIAAAENLNDAGDEKAAEGILQKLATEIMTVKP